MRSAEKQADERMVVGSRMDPKEVKRIDDLCTQTGWTRADFVARSASAVLEMILAGSLEVPELVTAARTLRERNATLTSARRPFPTPIGDRNALVADFSDASPKEKSADSRPHLGPQTEADVD